MYTDNGSDPKEKLYFPYFLDPWPLKTSPLCLGPDLVNPTFLVIFACPRLWDLHC
jgi:hypothetical protein